MSRPAGFLTFVRRLALLTPALAACSGSTPGTAITSAPPAPSTTASAVSSTAPPHDVTAGSGPCRCSWDTDGNAAPRVCKKGELNYANVACVPGVSPPIDDEALPVGPLPPPDLAVESAYRLSS